MPRQRGPAVRTRGRTRRRGRRPRHHGIRRRTRHISGARRRLVHHRARHLSGGPRRLRTLQRGIRVVHTRGTSARVVVRRVDTGIANRHTTSRAHRTTRTRRTRPHRRIPGRRSRTIRTRRANTRVITANSSAIRRRFTHPRALGRHTTIRNRRTIPIAARTVHRRRAASGQLATLRRIALGMTCRHTIVSDRRTIPAGRTRPRHRRRMPHRIGRMPDRIATTVHTRRFWNAVVGIGIRAEGRWRRGGVGAAHPGRILQARRMAADQVVPLGWSVGWRRRARPALTRQRTGHRSISLAPRRHPARRLKYTGIGVLPQCGTGIRIPGPTTRRGHAASGRSNTGMRYRVMS